MIARDFSVRAVVSGMVVGAVLSACNIYSGLKIGWSANMSITGSLIVFALWQLRSGATRREDPFTMLETNLSQAAVSSAAAVSTAGLASAVPALTILTGYVLPWPKLALWIFSVCIVGIVVAVPLRRQMIVNEPLPFPFGIATAEMLTQMYAKGTEGIARVRAMLIAAVMGGAGKVLEHLKVIGTVGFPGAFKGYALKNLTFAFDPSLLLIGIGGIMGLRASVSVAAGAVVAYGVIGPELLARGIVKPGAPERSWFPQLVSWLLWPGVTMMVVASLAGFALSWRSVAKAFRGLRGVDDTDADEVPSRWFLISMVVAFTLAVALQVGFFDIPIWAASLGVVLSFALAIVAARVQGETGVTPIGAMGKVTQLIVGAFLPGNVTANLMTANITGGSASQCADLMNDLKTGQMLGSTPRSQWVSQLCGAASGSLVGSAIYLVLIPNPKEQLFTEEWAAPSVIGWKAVAEVFKVGLDALPPHVLPAMALAASLCVILTVVEVRSPKHIKKWLPSAAAMGLGFVIPANQSFAMLVGGLVALLVARRFKAWHERFWMVVCAGVFAGESFVGVAVSLHQMIGG